MIDIAIHEQSLLRSAEVATEKLHGMALERAIVFDSLAGDVVGPEADIAKELLLEAVVNAGILVTEAAEAAKGLLVQASELAAIHKESIKLKAVADDVAVRALFVNAAVVVESQKDSLLVKAKIAAEALQNKALEDAIELVDHAHNIPHPTHGKARELLDKAVRDAKSLLKEASEDATVLLAKATETAKSLLLRDRKIEEELINLNKLASVGVLAGGIAHDFNNVLVGVLGNLEMAKLELSSDHAAYQFILAANQSIDRATSLTSQLLTFSKGGEPIFEIVDIEQIVDLSIKLSLSESKVKTILNIQHDLWVIAADKGQLSQVITNLIINADQAMPHGGTLTIEATNIKDISGEIGPDFSGKYICFSICDDGMGVSEERRKYIFQPYFTTKEHGSGLGLASAHSIIAKHRGHIGVKTELGKGTTFSIYLPVKSDVKIQDKALLHEKKNPIAYAAKILLMDDVYAVLDVTVSMIESLGYSVETVINGKQAIEKYIDANKCGKPFDVVIVDLTIPGGMGGEGTMKKLLGINPLVKVIVSSGYADGEVMSNFTDYGFKGRLVKPFRLRDLEAELAKILD